MKGNETFTFTKEVTGEIIQIPVDMLIPHPSNPRHDDGKDLDELVGSVKERGILQNLTVVPRDDGEEGYVVVIGHRRLQAAKKAGLKTVPAIIADMTIEQQVRTMLIENMQRSDLTALEQAEGFQMMFDFGDSVRQISKKTGFAETTVRHRLKMAELDKEALQAAVDHQITLDQLYRLEGLEDLNERNRILEMFGTNNYEWSLTNALGKQANKKKGDKIREIMEKLGVSKVESGSSIFRVAHDIVTVTTMDEKEIEEIVKAHPDPIYYLADGAWWEFKIGSRDVEEDEDDDEDESRAEWEAAMKERKEKLQKDADTAYVCRKSYIDTFTVNGCKKILPEIAKGMMLAVTCGIADPWEHRYSKDDQKIIDEMQEDGTAPEVILLKIAYMAFHDNSRITWDWEGEFSGPTKSHVALMTFLRSIGYKPSDVEESLMDGTHPAFYKPEDEDEETGENAES